MPAITYSPLVAHACCCARGTGTELVIRAPANCISDLYFQFQQKFDISTKWCGRLESAAEQSSAGLACVLQAQNQGVC